MLENSFENILEKLKSQEQKNPSEISSVVYAVFAELISEIYGSEKFVVNDGNQIIVSDEEYSMDSDIILSRPEENTVNLFVSLQNDNRLLSLFQKVVSALDGFIEVVKKTRVSNELHVVFGVDSEELKKTVDVVEDENGEYFIEQGCYGIFDPRKGTKIVGTTGMGPCSPLVIQNDQTGVFLFSHIDSANRASVIAQSALESLSENSEDTFSVISSDSKILDTIRYSGISVSGTQKVVHSDTFVWNGNSRQEVDSLILGTHDAYHDAKRYLQYSEEHNIYGGMCVVNDTV